jgi:hypothetical protein
MIDPTKHAIVADSVFQYSCQGRRGSAKRFGQELRMLRKPLQLLGDAFGDGSVQTSDGALESRCGFQLVGFRHGSAQSDSRCGRLPAPRFSGDFVSDPQGQSPSFGVVRQLLLEFFEGAGFSRQVLAPRLPELFQQLGIVSDEKVFEGVIEFVEGFAGLEESFKEFGWNLHSVCH